MPYAISVSIHVPVSALSEVRRSDDVFQSSFWCLYYTMSSNVKASIAAIWTIAHSALYGFHIASLNGVQASVICSDRSAPATRFGLRECLDLSVSLGHWIY
jgi:hypothetical protein